LQRNGMDPQTGLMYGVQGASYNHNHCNGMAMELYGIGEVMGIDAGAGPTYEHPLHVNYFSQWAAHNTVTAAGSSSSVPFSGSAGRKNIGQIELAAMEPMPDRDAVSPLCSFTDTRYIDISTGTSQMRTMALIRTSGKTGYYIDIFRSDNKVSNDYVYHNIGDQVVFLNSKREQIEVVPSEYPMTSKDYPGFRFFTGVKKLENWNDNLIMLFSIKDDRAKDIFMQVLVPGIKDRVYYQAKSLKTKTSGRQYSGKTLPLFTMRDEGESKSKPFISVFEPYRDTDGNNVERISAESRPDGEEFTALTVFNRDNSKQIVFQSPAPEKRFISEGNAFSGYFGVAGFTGDVITYLYIGAGTEISCKGYTLKTGDQKGSACLSVNGKTYGISCNQSATVTLPVSGVNKVILQSGKIKTRLKFTADAGAITFEVPQVRDAIISISNM